jgi:uncharacterized protein (DUF488 family)
VAGIRVATIGFTRSTAERFFERLKNAGVRKVIDVRLHNTSQLSGFAKSEDLRYLLKEVGGIDYAHMPLLAPSDDILKAYKRDGGAWSAYEGLFNALLQQRHVESRLQPADLADCCLLCSEDKPHYCHRRLVVEYLNREWHGALNVHHL